MPQSEPTANADAPRGIIRDRGYKPYEGKHTSESGRWGLIAGRMLKMTARQPFVIVLLILPVFPAIAYAVAMYIKAKMFAAGLPVGSPDGYVFDVICGPTMMVLAFLLAMFAGGGTVADDARAGAFQFYFARPVTREQYLVGKLIPPVALVAIVATAPGVLVACLRIALARDAAEATAEMGLPLKALGLGLGEALVLGIPIVALSSLSRGRGYVQGAFAGLFFLPWIVGVLLSRATSSPWPAILSIRLHLYNVGRVLFDYPIEEGDRWMPGWVSAAVLAALVVGSVALLRRRLASVEVIGS